PTRRSSDLAAIDEDEVGLFKVPCDFDGVGDLELVPGEEADTHIPDSLNGRGQERVAYSWPARRVATHAPDSCCPPVPTRRPAIPQHPPPILPAGCCRRDRA